MIEIKLAAALLPFFLPFCDSDVDRRRWVGPTCRVDRRTGPKRVCVCVWTSPGFLGTRPRAGYFHPLSVHSRGLPRYDFRAETVVLHMPVTHPQCLKKSQGCCSLMGT